MNIKPYLISVLIAFISAMSFSAQAAFIDSSHNIRIDYNTTFSPDTGGFTGVRYLFTFDIDGDRFDHGEGWNVTAFDNDGIAIGSSSYSELSHVFGGSGTIGLGLSFDTPPIQEGVGHILFSSIVGSFDLVDVSIELLYVFDSGNSSINNIANNVSVTTVPIPSTVFLFITGIIGLVGAARTGHVLKSNETS